MLLRSLNRCFQFLKWRIWLSIFVICTRLIAELRILRLMGLVCTSGVVRFSAIGNRKFYIERMNHMQILTLIAANTLLILLIIIGALLDRRLTRIELTQGAVEALTREVAELKTRAESSPAQNDAEEASPGDRRRAMESEKRFTEGVANILNYDMQIDLLRARKDGDIGGIL